MNKDPHPTEPDVADDRQALAEKLYADVESALRAGRQPVAALYAALFWLGYRAWILGSRGFTPPDTLRRRERLFRDLEGRPYHDDVVRIVAALGWERPPNREAAPKFEQLKPVVKVFGDHIQWGLDISLNRDLVFGCRYNLLRLRVEDHQKTQFSLDLRPPQDGWSRVVDMVAAGLTDDDYRIIVECLHDATAERASYPFDFAAENGEWNRLTFQGQDWDGEVGG